MTLINLIARPIPAERPRDARRPVVRFADMPGPMLWHWLSLGIHLPIRAPRLALEGVRL